MKIVIDVSNEKKAKKLIDILKDIPYVKSIKVESEIRKEKPDFESVFGIWKDREITLDNLRKKAWGKVIK
ncbi:hypothetical protein [Persephonella sp.]